MKQATADPHCWSCQAETTAGDRYCRACGAGLTSDGGRPRATVNKYGRRIAATMFWSGVAIILFAAVHRNPADLILVVGFALPLCGAGALAWRTN
jgi:predicted amidophosphoribosyltransferase